MPRTPLLRAVVGAVRDARAAPPPPPAAPSSRRWTRRDFLKAAGAAGIAGAAVGAGCLGPPTPAGRTPARVAVVGGGLAGLTCAYRLQAHGLDVTLYEGSPRLGGRCWTRRGDFEEGQTSEHGGEFIDSGHAAIQGLVEELGLELEDLVAAEPDGTGPAFFIGGEPYPYEDVLRDLQAVLPGIVEDYDASDVSFEEATPRGAQIDAMSITAYLDASVPGGATSRLGRLLLEAYESEYGADPSDQSALNLVYLLGSAADDEIQMYGESDERFHVKGGNDLIVARLGAALSDRIRPGHDLRSIARDGEEYALRFRTRDGEVPVGADRVVLCIPFSVMRDRVEHKEAGFSPLKARAIQELGMGNNVKACLQFGSRFWHGQGGNGEAFADEGLQSTWETTRGQGGTAGILVYYAGGRAALPMASGTPDEMAQTLVAATEPVFPGATDAWNGKATRDDWSPNKWTLGSYSYYRVGQFAAFSGVEGMAEGACHFAGEHTSVEAQGYLEGAVESGERAATEVLVALGLFPPPVEAALTP